MTNFSCIGKSGLSVLNINSFGHAAEYKKEPRELRGSPTNRNERAIYTGRIAYTLFVGKWFNKVFLFTL